MLLEALAVGLPTCTVLVSNDRPFEWSLTAGLVACGFLPLRLRWPWLAALVCVPAVVGGLGWSVVMVAQYRIGRTSRRVSIMAAWVVAMTIAAIVPVVITEDVPLGVLLIATAFSGGLAAAPTALGALVTTRRELTSSLFEVRRARAAELEAQEASARVAERARIAREIHDAVGHHTTLIAVEAAALAATTGEERTRETALRLRGLAKEALAEMRAALGLLNTEPAQSHDSLAGLVDRARAAGLAVRLDDRGASSLPPAVGRAVYRVVQEALTNVTKHAPGAAVQVKLDRSGEQVRVSVVNGPAPEAPLGEDNGGLGLHGLSERVRMVGGTLHTERRPDGGFAVEAVLPVSTAKDGDNDSTFGGSAHDAATA